MMLQRFDSYNALLLSGVLLFSLSACNTDVSSPASLEFANEELFTRLEVNHRAVLLSTFPPYDTIRLATVPMGAKNTHWRPKGYTKAEIDSIIRANPPTFISRDSTRVKVSSDGLVQVVRATTTTGTVQIIATQQIGPLTHACTTLVRALPVENPRTIHKLDISTVDSLKVAVNWTVPLLVTGKDANGIAIDNIVTYVESSDYGIMMSGGAKWNVTTIKGAGETIGQATIRVTTTAFGTVVRDSVMLRNGYPLNGLVTLGYLYRMKRPLEDVVVGPGAIVSWVNDTTYDAFDPDLDVIFETPELVLAALDPAQNTGGGNILGIPGDRTLPQPQKTRYRRFLTPGTYIYRVMPRNMLGRVIVRDR